VTRDGACASDRDVATGSTRLVKSFYLLFVNFFTFVRYGVLAAVGYEITVLRLCESL
jgi:hypothetical protein